MTAATTNKACKKCGGSAFQPKGRCVVCAKADKAEWAARNKDHIAAYRAANRERDRKKEAEYRLANPEKIKESLRKHIDSNPEAYKMKSRARYEKNIDREKARAKAFYEANKDRMLILCDAWTKANPEIVKETRARYKKKIRATPVGQLACNVSSRIRHALKSGGVRKTSRTFEILGCDWEFFKLHIEKQFTRGMSWEKMGKEIHIDHIVPVASAQTEEDLLRLNHFSNLRPLWAKENIRKSDQRMFLI